MLDDIQKRLDALKSLLRDEGGKGLSDESIQSLYRITRGIISFLTRRFVSHAHCCHIKALTEHNFKEASEANVDLMKGSLDPWMIGMKRLIDFCQKVKSS
jgi:hypothetical protein